MIDPTTALAFSLYENKGVYALLLGSGVSRAAHIQTGWEITLDLTRRLGLLEEAPQQADWAAWHLGRFGTPPSYSNLLDKLAPTQAERRSLLHSYIEPTAEDREAGRRLPTKAHVAIARLVRDGFIRVIITTNFDRLLETALRAEGIEPTVIRSDDDIAGAQPLTHATCYIVKVHGDYLDTRLRNTEGELAAYSSPMNTLLDRIIDEHGVIVCGWSSDWDTALRDTLTRAPSRRYPLFWASRGEPSPTAKDLIAHKAGRIITIDDAETFFTDLQAKIEVQAAQQRANPMSVELLVASIKTQMARPEGRIALNDLLSQEMRHIRAALQGPDFAHIGNITAESYRHRAQRYAALSEPLARAAFTLGRWGDGSEFALVQDITSTLLERPPEGSTALLDLALLPGILVSWGYLLGAAKSNRADVAARLLQTLIHDPGLSTPTKAAKRLNIELWSSRAKGVWRTFTGMEHSEDPACYVLKDIVHNWLAEEFVGAQGFDLAWGWTELLVGLEYQVERTSEDDLRTAIETRNPKSYVPVGTMTYDEKVAPQLLERLAQADTQVGLAAAGFAAGETEHIRLIQIWMADWIARVW